MPITNIDINSHRIPIGRNYEAFTAYKNVLPNIIKKHLNDMYDNNFSVRMFNFDKEQEKNNAGIPDSIFVIYCNSTKYRAGKAIETSFVLNNIEFNHMMPASGTGTIISYENVPIAEYHQNSELNILIDLFADYNEKRIEIFEHILSEINRLIIQPKIRNTSWKLTDDREKLGKNFINTYQQNNTLRIHDEKNNIRRLETDISSYRNHLKHCHDAIINKRILIKSLEQNIESLSSDILADFDKIISHKKITNLIIKDNNLIVTTDILYIHDSNDNTYYGGRYTIKINPFNADIRFYCDNTNRGYWTGNDPHPHVNGDNGTACLGNADEMIAELCSQIQIYAIVLVCIDFLESVNTRDPAGEYVRNWQQVDSEGNIIENTTYCCEKCGNNCNETFTVFEGVEFIRCDGDRNSCDDDCDICSYAVLEAIHPIEVCEDCYDNDTYEDERIGERIVA